MGLGKQEGEIGIGKIGGRNCDQEYKRERDWHLESRRQRLGLGKKGRYWDQETEERGLDQENKREREQDLENQRNRLGFEQQEGVIEKTKDTLRLGKQKGEIRIGKEGGRDRDLENRREKLGIGKTEFKKTLGLRF